MKRAGIEIIIRATDRASDPIRRVGSAASDGERRVSRMARALQTMGNATLAVTGIVRASRAVANAIAAPVQVAAEFEDKMARVGALSDASAEDMQRLIDTARKLGRDTRYSATQAAEGMEYLATAGFTAQQQIDALPGVLSMAAANATDLATTAEIASDALHGFGMEANKMGRVGDVLTKAAAESSTNLAGMGEAMKYVSPVARTAGAEIEQAAAAIGLLANVGIKGSSAGTSLRAMMLRLAAPSGKLAKKMRAEGADVSDVGKGRDALKFLGVDPNDKKGNVRPFEEVLADIDAAIKKKGLGSADKLNLLKKLFGEEAVSAAAELIEKAGTGALAAYIRKLQEAGGTTKTLADRMNATTRGALEEMHGAVEDLEIEIGNALTPTIRELAGKLGSSAESMQAWSATHKEELQTVAQVIGGVASSMLYLVELVGKAAIGYTRLGKAIGDAMSNSEVVDTTLALIGTITGNKDMVEAASKNFKRRELLEQNGGATYTEGPSEPVDKRAPSAGKSIWVEPTTITGEAASKNFKRRARSAYRRSDDGEPTAPTNEPVVGEILTRIELHDKRTDVKQTVVRQRGARISTSAGQTLPGSGQ